MGANFQEIVYKIGNALKIKEGNWVLKNNKP